MLPLPLTFTSIRPYHHRLSRRLLRTQPSTSTLPWPTPPHSHIPSLANTPALTPYRSPSPLPIHLPLLPAPLCPSPVFLRPSSTHPWQQTCAIAIPGNRRTLGQWQRTCTREPTHILSMCLHAWLQMPMWTMTAWVLVWGAVPMAVWLTIASVIDGTTAEEHIKLLSGMGAVRGSRTRLRAE